LRCGAATEVQQDHPTGTVSGRHLHRESWVPACVGCHRLRSRIDQRVGIEGGNVLTSWLLARRLAAWDGWLATAGRAIPFSSRLLAHRASVGEEVADMILNDLRKQHT
jgi:hypothetical protein